MNEQKRDKFNNVLPTTEPSPELIRARRTMSSLRKIYKSCRGCSKNRRTILR